METNEIPGTFFDEEGLFKIIVGDITQQEADAIVLSETGQGSIQLTEPDPATGLRCRYLIRIPSPGGSRSEIAAAYRTVLELAGEKGCRSIGIPLLRSGHTGTPYDYRTAESVFRVFLAEHEMRILFVLPNAESIYLRPSIDYGIRRALYRFVFRTFDSYSDAVSAPESPAPPIGRKAPNIPERKSESSPAKKSSASFSGFLKKVMSREDDRREADIQADIAPMATPAPDAERSLCCADYDAQPDSLDDICLDMTGMMWGEPDEKAEALNPLFDDTQAHNLQQLLMRKNETFSQMLFRLMEKCRNRDGSPMKEADLMRKACIDRRLLSKIRIDGYKPGSGPVPTPYHPSKDTAIQLAFAMELPLSETMAFLEKAGYTLTDSLPEDIAVKFLIRERIYDVVNLQTVLLKVRSGGYRF